MKRYIRSEYSPKEEVEEQFQPNVFTKESVDKILEDLLHELKVKYGKRYPDAQYQFDNVHFDDFYMAADVRIFNKNRDILNKKFEFQPYSDYWDEVDYLQHVNTNIQKFIRQV